MAQSLSKVYTHIIFSTKHRQNLIDDAIKTQLFQYLGGICKGLECNPVQIGGYVDHVHILCLLSRKITQMKLLEEVKKQSSKWIKTKSNNYANFYWQNGYGIFSVNPSEIDIVINYIKNQEEHHRTKKNIRKNEILYLFFITSFQNDRQAIRQNMTENRRPFYQRALLKSCLFFNLT